MKIVMFGQKRIPSREGGVEIVVEELATRMVERGHDVTCINRKGHHVSGREFDSTICNNYKGIHIKRAFTIDKKGLAAMTSSFFSTLKSTCGNYDVVHIHAEGSAAMCWIPKLRGKRVIVTIHGLDWVRAKWGRFATKYIKWGEKQAVKHADEIIVLSNGVREYFQKEYGRHTVLIPNGVNCPKQREAEKITKLWGLEKDSYILFVGRIVPEKGLMYLIDAWKKIKTDKKLVIAGGSSDTQAFMNELKELSNDSIVFTGFQQGIVLEELFSNCYIFCLPSDLEGMPLSLLEAMSYGNCCVVSDIPECTEATGKKAVVFRKSDTEDLREKLQMLLDDPAHVDVYKRESADYICGKFCWDDVVDQTLRLYNNEK